MKQVENAGVVENVKIEARNVSDHEVEVGEKNLSPGETHTVEKKNLVTSEGLKFLSEVLTGDRSETVDRIAVGDRESESNLTMESLQGTEHLREQVQDQNITKVANAETKLEILVDAGEPANQPVTIGEVGLFAKTKNEVGDFMFARAGLGADAFEKTSELELRFQYQIGFANQ